MTRRDVLAAGCAFPASSFGAGFKSKQNARVRHHRLPDGGIQPQIVADDRGTLHVLHYSGDARHGNVFYTRSFDGGATFSSAMQVSSSGSAVAAGTIRGAQLALGKGSRVHVAWNGSSQAEIQGPVNPESGKPGSAMLYARLNDEGTAFQREQNLMHRSFGLDGGGSVAADRAGNVYVAWHGIPVDAGNGAGPEGEAKRQVWVARSQDDGRTFVNEERAWERTTGACACCGMKVFATRKGAVYALYRSATEAVHRDIYLISSKDGGKTFEGDLLHKWEINACPMSSMDFAENSSTIIAAWETGGQVYWARIDGRAEAIRPVAAPGSTTGRKHPRLALNQDNELLFVWTEGTGWQRGGSVAWQLYDRSGQPTSEKGLVPGISAWSFAAPAVNADGSFSILY